MSEETRTTNATTGGQKGVKIERFDLIPVRPLSALARHYGVGAAKYEDRNWERGYEWSKSYAALQRHLNAFWGGEDIDPENGQPHLAAAAFHVFALLEWGETHPELDDRPTQDSKADYEQGWRDGYADARHDGIIKGYLEPVRSGGFDPLTADAKVLYKKPDKDDHDKAWSFDERPA